MVDDASGRVKCALNQDDAANTVNQEIHADPYTFKKGTKKDSYVAEMLFKASHT